MFFWNLSFMYMTRQIDSGIWSHFWILKGFTWLSLTFFCQIDNLLEQLKDKDKQLSGLRDRVQGLQTDSSNTDTALATLEEALSEKVQGNSVQIWIWNKIAKHKADSWGGHVTFAHQLSWAEVKKQHDVGDNAKSSSSDIV